MVSMDEETVVRHVQVLEVEDCPLVDRLIALIDDCRAEAGRAVEVERLVGEYPSPTLVADGIDVATGQPVADRAYCRMDLPTREQVVAALRG
jgi:hypothetical protein